MINAKMRLYNYYTIGGLDEYGQPQMPNANTEPVGKIKMAINISSQSVLDNIKFVNCTYIGLTSAEVKDTYIIEYGEERLKVLYVNNNGRLKQVYMSEL